MKPELISKAMEQKILDRIGALVRDEAKRLCPVDNSGLRQSIQYTVGTDRVIIFSDLKYAPYVEYGTGIYHIGEDGEAVPHTGWDIEPVNAKALRFEVGRKGRLASKGKMAPNIVFAKKVHIEGMHAQPFMRPALHQNISRIKDIIREEVSG